MRLEYGQARHRHDEQTSRRARPERTTHDGDIMVIELQSCGVSPFSRLESGSAGFTRLAPWCPPPKSLRGIGSSRPAGEHVVPSPSWLDGSLVACFETGSAMVDLLFFSSSRNGRGCLQNQHYHHRRHRHLLFFGSSSYQLLYTLSLVVIANITLYRRSCHLDYCWASSRSSAKSFLIFAICHDIHV